MPVTSKDKFFSILARDLRSPFNPLLGMARSLAQTADMTPPAQIKETVERILHSVRNVYDLLENLLKWLSIQGGQIEYEPESLSLKEISERNSRLLAETAVNKQITLRCVLADTLYVYS